MGLPSPIYDCTARATVIFGVYDVFLRWMHAICFMIIHSTFQT